MRSRIDWKYVLRLELTDAGFDVSVLSEFRSRLISGAAESLLFDTLLTWCRDRQLIRARGRQRTDSTHILAVVRALNRIEDGETTPQIHVALQQRGLLPRAHSVDTGFLIAELLVESQGATSVDVLGPMRLDDHWQARAGAGVDAQHFPIDWDQQHASCPAGKPSISWTPAIDNRGNPVIKVKCSAKECRRCHHLENPPIWSVAPICIVPPHHIFFIKGRGTFIDPKPLARSSTSRAFL